MRLGFYSGGDPEDNIQLDAELLKMLGKIHPKITFIPSCFESSESYFEEFRAQYSLYGITDFQIFNLDRNYSHSDAEKYLDADLVYLSGGNTYYFLNQIRRTKFYKLIHKYVRTDGVLAGQSAGALIMTPNIRLAGIPTFDADDNNVGITNLKSLGYSHFEFSPHYTDQKAYSREFTEYSKGLRHPVYACTDGSGIIVDGVKTIFVGDVWGFVRGQKFVVSESDWYD